MIVHVGITGTRLGATSNQVVALQVRLAELRASGAQVFHHGDCIGADAQGHRIAQRLGFRIVVHPPSDTRFRAWCGGEQVECRVPKPYLVRDNDIVNESDLLFVVPKESAPSAKHTGGTWYTARYAERVRKPCEIIWRDS